MNESDPNGQGETAPEPDFSRTLGQVLVVQVVALTLLGLLQFFYNA